MPGPWWWRDLTVLAQLQVLLGVVGALFALVAVLYAWRVARRQFRIMADQDALMNKQVLLMQEETATGRRLEALTNEQATILKRQGQIAETQHQILQEQLVFKSAVNVKWRNTGEARCVEIYLTNLAEFSINRYTGRLFHSDPTIGVRVFKSMPSYAKTGALEKTQSEVMPDPTIVPSYLKDRFIVVTNTETTASENLYLSLFSRFKEFTVDGTADIAPQGERTVAYVDFESSNAKKDSSLNLDWTLTIYYKHFQRQQRGTLQVPLDPVMRYKASSS